MFHLSNRSIQRLDGVHSDLVAVVERAITITNTDFSVLEGLRTAERQKQLFDSGSSRTLKSRHLTGHAVDLGAYVGGRINWGWKHYHNIADAMKQAADELGVVIEWGGDWETFKDGPHFQLSWSAYPASEVA